ncbi:MAG: glycoside hydrolase family 38 C-terminal domain-containing protein [Acidimicrobiales bacterium]
MLEDRETIRRHISGLVRTAVRPAIHPRTVPLEITACHVHGEPIGADEARARSFEPFAVGQAWGGMWDTTWFRMRAAIPGEWGDADEIVALVTLGGGADVGFTAEGLIWEDGRPAQGLHHQHRGYRVRPPARARAAQRPTDDRNVDLLIEAAANPVPPWTDTEFPLLMPDPGGRPLYVVSRAELATVDAEVEALWFDMRTLLQLVKIADEPTASAALGALRDAAQQIDRQDVSGTAKSARAALAEVLAHPARRGHTITAVGHAHIDTAWLWPIRETKRKCARTFANQLRLMDEYPEYRFTCSQAQQYQWIKEGYPDLWERIVERVASGQWEPVGGMWVEADTNLVSGESLVRQFVHGKRFFLDEFGVETTEVWIPDVFGYSAALPQIANQAGSTSFITQKMSWNTTNRFPHHTFWWEGLDGSRLFTHFPPAATYNGDWSAAELVNSARQFSDHGHTDRSLYPFGYGDGGGGPTREMLEYATRMGDLEGLPRVELGTVGDFLDQARSEAEGLGVWVGELYLETHRGTYTTHADVKSGNRRGEEALRAAEMWGVAVATRRGSWANYPADELDRLWKLLLLHQFHDIIPGSSIHWVYEDSRRDHGEVLTIARQLIGSAQRDLGGREESGSIVFNAASHTRREVVDLAGGPAMVEVPACGWAPATASARRATHPETPVAVTDSTLDNGHLRVTWDADGLLTSVWDHDNHREVLVAGRRGNVFQLHEDHPNAYDAWDVDITYLDQRTELTELTGLTVVERDPLRGAVAMVRPFGASTVTQTMRLTAGSRRLDFDTTVDWYEDHRFLKVMFPVAVRSSRATYGIQHGWVERPTVVNTSWDAARYEVCAHRWADLGEAGYGVALLNDSKYGYDIRGDEMRLSLLRAPGYPDPTADRGRHRFVYALFPHDGDLQQVIDEAEALNLPLIVHPGTGSGTAITIDRPGVSVEALKKADRDTGVVLRICEVRGARGPVRITPGFPATSVSRTDLLERPTGPCEQLVDGTVTVDLRPFELVTLRFDGLPG